MYDQQQIWDVPVRYYTNLYNDPFPIRPKLEGVDFERISEDQNRWMERPFTMEEILGALKSMEEDKAPGPDGFPTKFLIACWEVVGKDVLDVFFEFYYKDQWCKSLSATFISLIPKKNGRRNSKTLGLLVWWDAFIKCWPRRLLFDLNQLWGMLFLKHNMHSFLVGR